MVGRGQLSISFISKGDRNLEGDLTLVPLPSAAQAGGKESRGEISQAGNVRLAASAGWKHGGGKNWRIGREEDPNRRRRRKGNHNKQSKTME